MNEEELDDIVEFILEDLFLLSDEDLALLHENYEHYQMMMDDIEESN